MLKSPFKNTASRALLFFAIGLLLYGLGKWQIAHSNAPIDLVVGSKNFTESRILAELAALALEKNGFHVQRKFSLGGTLIAQAALQKGEIDLYPEYTGTGLINVLGYSTRTEKNLPLSPDKTWQILNREYGKRWNLQWLKPADANDSQGLVISRATAEKYQLYTISRLAELSPHFRLAAIPEFEDREDGLAGLRKAYPGLHFKRVQQYDNGLKYRVLLNHHADVTVAFTTDGALVDPNLVLLEDDHHFWPEYRVALVARQEVLKDHPLAAGILNRVFDQLDTATLRELNAAVDCRKQDYQTVARNFLKSRRIL
jgi:osmoprotectant transport system substrate-binding protein